MQNIHDIDAFAEELRAASGVEIHAEHAQIEPYIHDWRRRYSVNLAPVAFPRNTAEVSCLMRFCHEQGIQVIPQGGNTGLSGGTVVPDAGKTVIINTHRLSQIIEADEVNCSVTVGAGCVLDTVNEVLNDTGMYLPIQLGSSGSCQIGGLIAANAGGINAIKYGVVRDLVLGLEVVLPDGQVWNGLRKVYKDNSGYNLKHWFIGSEGTLGVITAACLKTVARPMHSVSAMIAVEDVSAAVRLFCNFRRKFQGKTEAFEIISRDQLLCVTNEMKLTSPMEVNHAFYLMVELSSFGDSSALQSDLENILEAALDTNLIIDAVIANNSAKAQHIWTLRHSISEANIRTGPTIASDTCVPVSQLPSFINTVHEKLRAEIDNARVHFTGHLGDGNVHVSVVLDRGVYADPALRAETVARVNDIVQRLTYENEGVISAEHGIGSAYLFEMNQYRADLDIELMTQIKRCLDPRGIMNPGKVLPEINKEN